MDRRGKSLVAHYDSPEEALRWALVHMAEQSGLNRYLLAPQVDLSPSHLSKALNPYKSEDDTERRHHFPADRVSKFIEATGDLSYLLTLLDLLGYDPSRLPEIRRPSKSQAQLVEDLASEVKAARTVLEKAGKQLELMVPLATTVEKKRRTSR